MLNNESGVERHAGVDMIPVVESYEWNLGPDDSTPGSLQGLHQQDSLCLRAPTLPAVITALPLRW